MKERSRKAGGTHAGRIRRTLAATTTVTVAVTLLAGSPAGAQDDDFINGEAEGSADTFTLNIKQGNANIGFTYGRTLTSYRDRTASAEARALDLGVLPTLFAVDQCDGSTPPMNPDTLPPKTRVDSTEPGSTRSRRTEVFVPGTDGGPHGESAGHQDAVASAQPLSRGTTESVDTDIFLLALDGGRTEVTTRLEGRVREAHAVSTAQELRVFGDLFTFANPRWEAIARSGDAEATEGSFTFDSATVLGMPRTNEEALRDFGEFERGLEQLLRPFGVQLDLPTVEISDGRVRVTPMAFRIVDPPFGTQVLAPFFGAVQPLREVAARQAVEEDCTAALSITLLDVILGVAAGSGSIEVLAGGVDAFTAATDFSVEPLEPLPTFALPPPPPLDVAPVEPMPELDPDLGPAVELAPVTTAAPPADAEPEPEVESVASERSEESAIMPTSRFEDTEAGAAAVGVGIAGFLGAVGLVLGDRLRSRRVTRRAQ